MEFVVNVCVILTTVFAFGYLCFAIIRPEHF